MVYVLVTIFIIFFQLKLYLLDWSEAGPGEFHQLQATAMYASYLCAKQNGKN